MSKEKVRRFTTLQAQIATKGDDEKGN